MSRRRAPAQLPDEPTRTSFATAEVVRDPDRPSLVRLLLDGVESSALDLDDPGYLDFEYMQHIRLLIAAHCARPGDADGTPRRMRVLHLGAAGCALPRALAATMPVHQLAVELDAELARLVRQWFPLPSAPCLRIRVGEARQELESGHALWQAVVRDAFMNREVPGQLRTVESARRVHDVLEPGGLYALNTVASAGLRRIDEEFAALTSVFQDVVAIADPAVFSGRRFGNVVVAASDRRFDLPTVEREVRRLSLLARVMDRGTVSRRAASVRPLEDAAVPWPESAGSL